MAIMSFSGWLAKIFDHISATSLLLAFDRYETVGDRACLSKQG